MKTKQEIVENWLPRYTGLPLEKFGKYILLTNFQNYVDRFAEWQGIEVVGAIIRCPAPLTAKSPLLILAWVVPMQPPLWIC